MAKKKKQGKKQKPPKLQQDTDGDKKEKQKKKIKPRNLLENADADKMEKFKKQLQSPLYDELYNLFESQHRHNISAANNETENPVTPGCNQSEDINLPHSSCSGSSTAHASGQKASQKKGSIKETKNVNLSNLSSSGSSTAHASGQKASQNKGSIKETKNVNLSNLSSSESSTAHASGQKASQKKSSIKTINLPNSSSKKTSSLYNTGNQVDQKNDNSKKTNKNERIPPKAKSQIIPNLPVLKQTKTITEKKKLSSNIDDDRQSRSLSVPIKYSDNKKCQKDDQVITQVKAGNKANVKVETLEPDKSTELVSNTLKSVHKKEHIQTTEDLTKEKKKLQQKLRTCEEEMKHLNEQEHILLSPIKEEKRGIRGMIEVLVTDKSVKKTGKESSHSCKYDKDSGKIFIKDQNIKITIDVTEGFQVACKSSRPVTDLVEDVKFSSGILEGYSTERPEEKKLLSTVKGMKKEIMGRIEVLATDKSVKTDKESSLSFKYNKDSGKIFIKDQNIKISIDVTDGVQVACKSTRPVTDLVEDVKSSSGTLEGYSTERPEEQKLLSPVKGTKKGLMGRIEILETDKSVKKTGKESSLSCIYNKDSGKIFIMDQNIKITTDVTEDIQVVCKSTQMVTDLMEDVKSSSRRLFKRKARRP